MSSLDIVLSSGAVSNPFSVQSETAYTTREPPSVVGNPAPLPYSRVRSFCKNDAGTIMLAVFNSSILSFDSSGNESFVFAHPNRVSFSSIFFKDGVFYIYLNSGTLYATTTDGVNFTLTPTAQVINVTGLILSFVNGNLITSGTTCYYSYDMGMTWSTRSNPADIGRTVYFNGYYFSVRSTTYSRKIFRTSDISVPPTEVTLPYSSISGYTSTDYTVSSMIVFNGRLILGCNYALVFTSTDGITFTESVVSGITQTRQSTYYLNFIENMIGTSRIIASYGLSSSTIGSTDGVNFSEVSSYSVASPLYNIGLYSVLYNGFMYVEKTNITQSYLTWRKTTTLYSISDFVEKPFYYGASVSTLLPSFTKTGSYLCYTSLSHKVNFYLNTESLAQDSLTYYDEDKFGFSPTYIDGSGLVAVNNRSYPTFIYTKTPDSAATVPTAPVGLPSYCGRLLKVYNSTYYVATTHIGTSYLPYSTDGVNFTNVTAPSNNFELAVYNNFTNEYLFFTATSCTKKYTIDGTTYTSVTGRAYNTNTLQPQQSKAIFVNGVLFLAFTNSNILQKYNGTSIVSASSTTVGGYILDAIDYGNYIFILSKTGIYVFDTVTNSMLTIHVFTSGITSGCFMAWNEVITSNIYIVNKIKLQEV